MSESQGGQVLVFQNKPAQQRQHIHQLFANQPQSIVHDHQVGVIADIAAGRPQMDDPLGIGTLHAISIDMRHHIVAHLFFPRGGYIIIDIVLVGFQLGNLFIGDGQAQLLFGFGQGDPEFPPGAKLVIGRKQVLHLLAGIAGSKGRFITVRHKQPPDFIKIQTYRFIVPFFTA